MFNITVQNKDYYCTLPICVRSWKRKLFIRPKHFYRTQLLLSTIMVELSEIQGRVWEALVFALLTKTGLYNKIIRRINKINAIYKILVIFFQCSSWYTNGVGPSWTPTIQTPYIFALYLVFEGSKYDFRKGELFVLSWARV